MADAAMLRLQDVEVAYGPTTVLRGVSLEVPRGAVVALLGGNGSGKSTTLNAISGFIRPRRGDIVFDGARIDGLATDAIVKAGLAQVPQAREVFNAMTVAENIELGAVTRRDRAAVQRDRERVFEQFPVLRARLRQLAGTLSGGEQAMLSVARALMAAPRMLLMDEPSAGLAPLVVDQLTEHIGALNRTGLTILLVEQNVGAALAVAERAYVLRDGVVAMNEEARNLVDNPDIVRAYLGR
jgi:branched-chain amino acid transport system ATP-binding protein